MNSITTDVDARTAFRLARATSELRELPALVVWVLQQDAPSLGPRHADGSKRTKLDFGALPMQAHAFEGPDELYCPIVDAAIDFAAQRRELPPGSVLRWVHADRNCTGFGPFLIGTNRERFVHHLTAEITDWLADRIDYIPDLAGGDDFLDDLHTRFRSWDGMFPQAPRPPRLYSRRLCDVCQTQQVEAAETDEGVIELKCRRCGQVYEGDLHSAFLRQLGQAA